MAHIPLPALITAPVAPAVEQIFGSLFTVPAFEVPPDTSPPNAQALHATFLI
jgi:hypothetical protein